MTTSANSSTGDLLDHIQAFSRLLSAKTKEGRLAGRHLGEASIRRGSGAGRASATIEFDFKAGHGMDHVLTTIVTDDVIDTPERREELARDFVLHMERAVARAATGAASRRAIALAAAEVASEAQAEGIELEVLRLESAPIHVFGKPRVEDEDAQVFYVHIVMPHLENGVLTRDSYTIDADGGEEFADYLRSRTLPELRTLIQKQGSLKSAA